MDVFFRDIYEGVGEAAYSWCKMGSEVFRVLKIVDRVERFVKFGSASVITVFEFAERGTEFLYSKFVCFCLFHVDEGEVAIFNYEGANVCEDVGLDGLE